MLIVMEDQLAATIPPEMPDAAPCNATGSDTWADSVNP